MAQSLHDPESSKFLGELFSKVKKVTTDENGRIVIEVSGNYVPPREEKKEGVTVYK